MNLFIKNSHYCNNPLKLFDIIYSLILININKSLKLTKAYLILPNCNHIFAPESRREAAKGKEGG